jgi:hypothetical protein
MFAVALVVATEVVPEVSPAAPEMVTRQWFSFSIIARTPTCCWRRSSSICFCLFSNSRFTGSGSDDTAGSSLGKSSKFGAKAYREVLTQI